MRKRRNSTAEEPVIKDPSGPKHQLSKPEDWLEQHGDALYRYAYFRLHEEAVAEDLVQETLLAALQARPGFGGRSSERTWLIAILKNKLVDYLRKRSREQPLDELLESDEEFEAFFSPDRQDHWTIPPSVWNNPMASLEQQQFWHVFSECMENLPPRQAQVFILCELDGLDGAEICQVLGVAATNMWVLLHRARLRLRQCLDLRWFDRGRGHEHADV